MRATKEDIRELAYLLWDRAGRPELRDKHFWYRAEQLARNLFGHRDYPTFHKQEFRPKAYSA